MEDNKNAQKNLLDKLLMKRPLRKPSDKLDSNVLTPWLIKCGGSRRALQ